MYSPVIYTGKLFKFTACFQLEDSFIKTPKTMQALTQKPRTNINCFIWERSGQITSQTRINDKTANQKKLQTKEMETTRKHSGRDANNITKRARIRNLRGKKRVGPWLRHLTMSPEYCSRSCDPVVWLRRHWRTADDYLVDTTCIAATQPYLSKCNLVLLSKL